MCEQMNLPNIENLKLIRSPWKKKVAFLVTSINNSKFNFLLFFFCKFKFYATLSHELFFYFGT